MNLGSICSSNEVTWIMERNVEAINEKKKSGQYKYR